MGDKRLIDNEWITVDECYEKHKKFVTHMKNKYSRLIKTVGLEDEDARSVSVIGFTKAFHRFDQDKGLKFVSLAGELIRGEILRYVRDHGKGLYFPRTARDLVWTVSREENADLTDEEIAEKVDAKASDVRDARVYMNYEPFSFEKKLALDDGHSTLHDIVGQTRDFITPINFSMFIDGLDDEEKRIVSLKLRDFTQREIGEDIGKPQVQVGRILKKIRNKYDLYNKGEKIIC